MYNYLLNSKYGFHRKDSLNLHKAIKNNDLKEIENLLCIGKANVNFVHAGLSCLNLALQQQNYESLNLLLKYGADPNQGKVYTSSWLPLHSYSTLEIAMGAIPEIPLQMDAAKLLIMNGADYNKFLSCNISSVQRKELDYARKEYLLEGKEIMKNIYQTVVNNKEIQMEDLTHKLNLDEFSLRYGSDVQSQDYSQYNLYLYNAKNLEEPPVYHVKGMEYMIEAKLKKIYQVIKNDSIFDKVIDSIKSFFGYYESKVTKKIHSLNNDIKHLLTLQDEQLELFKHKKSFFDHSDVKYNIITNLSGEMNKIEYIDFNY